jgi:hypothetical protein
MWSEALREGGGTGSALDVFVVEVVEVGEMGVLVVVGIGVEERILAMPAGALVASGGGGGGGSRSA